TLRRGRETSRRADLQNARVVLCERPRGTRAAPKRDPRDREEASMGLRQMTCAAGSLCGFVLLALVASACSSPAMTGPDAAADAPGAPGDAAPDASSVQDVVESDASMVSATIGSAGGTVRMPGVSLEIPRDALAMPTTITIERTADAAPMG